MAQLDPIRSTKDTPSTTDDRERKEPIPFPLQVREEPINLWKVAGYTLILIIILAAITYWLVRP